MFGKDKQRGLEEFPDLSIAPIEVVDENVSQDPARKSENNIEQN